MDLLQTVLATLVTLGILVTIHEWGHFYVARRCGVRVLTFSVGFGKPLFGWRDKQGTEYVVAAIPLGGYVRMLDEREAPVPEHLLGEAFNRKPVHQRIAVVAAGPIVNLLFALFAYWLMFVVGVTAIKPSVSDIQPGSPAAVAGMPAGGEIVAIDGAETASWDAVNLRLAARVGESGEVDIRVRYPERYSEQAYTIPLTDWRVDLERESPAAALGLIPWSPDLPPVIGRLLEDGVAASSGLQAGDRVVRVNGESIDEWFGFVERIQQSPGQAVTLLVERGERTIEIRITPAVRSVDGQTMGYIGAGVASIEWPDSQQRTIQYGLLDAMVRAVEKTTQMIALILDSIWKMLEGVISVKNLSGPITIAKVAGASAESGMEAFVGFLAYLSISLGVLNLLPIPMLDGGHLLYYTVELLRGKPVSERVQMIGLRLGMAVLFSLMTIAIVNDLMRL